MRKKFTHIGIKKGFVFVELIVSLLLIVMFTIVIADFVITFLRAGSYNASILNLEQNIRVVINKLYYELEYSATTIIMPNCGEASTCLEIHSSDGDKLVRFFIDTPPGAEEDRVIYRYAEAYGTGAGGKVQLTEPHRTQAESLNFRQVAPGIIQVDVCLKDVSTGCERQMSAQIVCRNIRPADRLQQW